MNKFLKEFKDRGYFYQCTNENELSAPFLSQFGWHILEVTGTPITSVTSISSISNSVALSNSLNLMFSACNSPILCNLPL